MKRLIACAALLVYAAVVFTATRELVGVRADDFPLKSTNDAAHGTFFNLSVEAEPVQDFAANTEVAAPAVESNPFADFGNDPNRQKLLERTKAKIELMSDEEVKESLQATDAEIREREAEKRLNDVINSLGSINKDFEGTAAATKAAKLLQFHQNPEDFPSLYPPAVGQPATPSCEPNPPGASRCVATRQRLGAGTDCDSLYCLAPMSPKC
ncbi:MAG: hypothetical protein U0992_06405 [Planctomycetaceae bacterium]